MVVLRDFGGAANKALRTKLPHALQRGCMQHLGRCIKKRHGNVKFAKVWPMLCSAVLAPTKADCDVWMTCIRNSMPDVCDYIEGDIIGRQEIMLYLASAADLRFKGQFTTNWVECFMSVTQKWRQAGKLLQLLDGTWRIGQLPNQVPNKLAGAPIQKARLEADVFHHLRMIRNDPNTLVQSNASEEQLKKYGLD